MLEIKNLSKSYEKNIFKNLNLQVNDGEVLSIVGPSGIGKSTLLRIIAGLESADSGEIILDNESLDLTANRNNSLIGVIFQDFNLFPNLTVEKNLTLAPTIVNGVPDDLAKKQAENTLAELGISEKSEAYPSQLSGGQKQRVAIGRALMMEPKVLAYDEPTSALDQFSIDQVIGVVKQLKKQKVTQLIVTHDLEFAKKVSDRIFDFQKEVIKDEK
jgi:polar amino acid transport system ATP-binding protein